MLDKFETFAFSLDKVTSKRFLIPSYQRPYVWETEQVNKLLSDFLDAYQRNDQHYFIGTVLTSKKGELNELIDGQQRFTTLWLIAVSFKIIGVNSNLLEFLKKDDELRFDFAIRKQLKAYLLSLLEKGKNERNQYTDKEVESDDYLINIAKAVSTITSKLENIKFVSDKSLKGLGNYIYYNVQFVMNIAPEGTNLNKLFSTINSSGIQLEQSDILKSKFLSLIPKTEDSNSGRLLFSKIWEACENLDSYFERNVRDIFSKSNWKELEIDDFKEFNAELFRFKNYEVDSSIGDEGFSIDDILDNNTKMPELRDNWVTPTNNDQDDNESVNCNSIIDFPKLLLHTLRIFLFKKGQEDFTLPFHTKFLLEIFDSIKNKDKSWVEEFILLLWQVRFVFDKKVVKWVEKDEDKDKNLIIARLHKNDDNGNRWFTRNLSTAKGERTMLQSVLYFTGNYNTQIWLSPFLCRMLNGENSIETLEDIDNKLSLSKEEDKNVTYKLMDPSYVLEDPIDMEVYLKLPLSTSFKHYWFQKLEYVLWKQMSNKKRENKFKLYRITSKNSVEHVFPQHHEFGEKIDGKILHGFGNLALLNVSQNSSYSNQDVRKKKVDFDNKLIYDSLKLAWIYENPSFTTWGTKEIMAHQDEMITLLKEHYNLI